ncbi:MAG: 50S ribosomal protein L30e [Candidatus Micrarchaeota archaeon]
MPEEDTPEEEAAEEAQEAEAAEEEKPAEETAAEETAEERKERKKKKVVRRRKTKKEREKPLTMAVRLAVESGKVEFGARSSVAAGSAKLFVIASNTPAETRGKVESFAKASNIPVIEFDGSTIELGSVCGKPFPVSVLSVFEEGSSNILDLAKKK